MHRLWFCAAVMMTLAAAPAFAAADNSHPAESGPVHGMVTDQDQPIQIEAATLEVRDKIKQATFSGDVQVVQGATTMKCQTLVVFYGQEVGIGANAPAQAGAKPAAMPTSAQNIRKIEARGGVTVVTKDQNASGDLGVYDLKSKTITLTGNVVVSQGQDVIHGERVVVDTITGDARVESTNAGGAAPSRVRALIQPNKGGGSGNTMTLGPSRPN
jgi:lipopolysaccharide export system protein LptA